MRFLRGSIVLRDYEQSRVQRLLFDIFEGSLNCSAQHVTHGVDRETIDLFGRSRDAKLLEHWIAVHYGCRFSGQGLEFLIARNIL